MTNLVQVPAFKPGVPVFFVSTVGGAPLAVIKQYIENQKHG